ncbi:hypothetical protein ABIF91_001589 [Bradyrhizobium sp. USDA 241]
MVCMVGGPRNPGGSFPAVFKGFGVGNATEEPVLDLLNTLYREGRHRPGKGLNQCYALANAAYLLGAQHRPAHMVRAAIDTLRAAFEN